MSRYRDNIPPNALLGFDSQFSLVLNTAFYIWSSELEAEVEMNDVPARESGTVEVRWIRVPPHAGLGFNGVRSVLLIGAGCLDALEWTSSDATAGFVARGADVSINVGEGRHNG